MPQRALELHKAERASRHRASPLYIEARHDAPDAPGRARGMTMTWRMLQQLADYGSGLYSVRGVLAILISVSAARRSSRRKAMNSSDEVGAESTACLSRNSTNFGSRNSFTNSALMRASIAGGVPRGAARPHQPWP